MAVTLTSPGSEVGSTGVAVAAITAVTLGIAIEGDATWWGMA